MSAAKLTSSDVAKASMFLGISYLILSNLLLWNHATFFVVLIYIIPMMFFLLANFRKNKVVAIYQATYILISGVGVWNHDFGLIIFAFALFLLGKFIPAFR